MSRLNFSRFKAVLAKVGIVNHFNFKMVIAGLFLGLLIIFNGCKTKQVVVESENIVYVHSDSTIIKDSTVIIPIERYVDVVPWYDTLVLSTSIAESKSWVDSTNHILRGEIKNLNAVEYKYVEVERIVINDSIVEKQVPIPYPVVEEKNVIPTFAIICICWTVISFIILLGLAYLKFVRP